jgi:hypothetical protein
MIDVSQNFFVINNDVAVDSVSYELYSNNGFKKIIASYSVSSIQNLDLLLNLKVSFGFSLIDQEDFVFEDKNTYYVRDLYDPTTSSFSVQVSLEDQSTSDLFAYVRIFDENDPLNIYDKLYKENLITNNSLLVANFVDYTLDDDSSFINDYKDPRQLQEEYIEENYNKIQNYSYTTDDVQSYVKDNNPIKFLNDDQDFNNYIKQNNSVEEVQGYVYFDKQHTFLDAVEIPIDLQDVLGRVYGINFELPEDFEKSNLYGYEAQISFRDVLIEYLTKCF